MKLLLWRMVAADLNSGRAIGIPNVRGRKDARRKHSREERQRVGISREAPIIEKESGIGLWSLVQMIRQCQGCNRNRVEELEKAVKMPER
jgi:hypothetical protein